MLYLALLDDNPEIVQVVIDRDYDKLAILRSAIENNSELTVEYLIDAFDFIPTWIVDLLIKHEYDISRAVTKTDSLQRSAEIAALDGNVEALKTLIATRKVEINDMMLAIAIVNNIQDEISIEDSEPDGRMFSSSV